MSTFAVFSPIILSILLTGIVSSYEEVLKPKLSKFIGGYGFTLLLVIVSTEPNFNSQPTKR
ncbi:hypothetical protein GGS20DRAFT_541138 [Poronia punctata]|nr:hypothetical protein GGS20DRAFT_541138 [Poronia punctata]